MKKTKVFTMPPVEFSNALSWIYGSFDFTDWENSKEWRLFNAGRAAALDYIATDTKMLAKEYDKIVRD